MRSTLSWSDLARTRPRVGIFALGREGTANLRTCLALGLDPTLVDEGAATVEGREVRSGAAGADALLGCDVVIKTPGISRRTNPTVLRLLAAGIPVVGGLGLWLQDVDRSRVLCVTGTKGKSSTVSIAGHLLRGLGLRCLVGGNIGVPPYDPALDTGPVDFWVIEVSSYQAADLASSPPVVAVTSLHPDHLPWHGEDAEAYYRDKLSLCSRPGADLTIANGDSDLLRDRRDQLGPRVEWVHATDDPDADWMAPLGLLGAHNRRNALIARAALRALGVEASDSSLRMAAAGFQHLESRLRPVATVDGVTFVDDSLSTNVLPTLAAVEAFPDRPVALIVGGFSRGIDYASLAVGLRSRSTRTRLLTVPGNGRHIGEVVRATGAGPLVEVGDCDDLESAVSAGFAWARPGGVVLLSPAAASFDRYVDYRDRAAAFLRAVGVTTRDVPPADMSRT
jgi:UDP-N-acetylmuramoylalanine--D-glutamate ligase